MLAIERRNEIENLIRENKSVLVVDLAKRFDVTTETIRSDLERLEAKGVLKRTYGGATVVEEDPEPTFNERSTVNFSGKEKIGQKAAELINDGETIFIDASTSSLHLAKYIKTKRSLTVITNAAKVVEELAVCEHITVICVGGKLKSRNMSFVGRVTENGIREHYSANKVFFSCKGLSAAKGLTDQSDAEADVKKAMIDMAEKCIFLCDYQKFDRIGISEITRLDNVDIIITDEKPSDEWYDEFNKNNVELILA